MCCVEFPYTIWFKTCNIVKSQGCHNTWKTVGVEQCKATEPQSCCKNQTGCKGALWTIQKYLLSRKAQNC